MGTKRITLEQKQETKCPECECKNVYMECQNKFSGDVSVLNYCMRCGCCWKSE